MNPELRVAATACLRLAGEQVQGMSDTKPHIAADHEDFTGMMVAGYPLQDDLADELRKRCLRNWTASECSPSFSGGYSHVHAEDRRQQDDPPEAVFAMLQVWQALDMLDEPKPSTDPNGAYAGLFRHVFVEGRPARSYRGAADLSELIRVVADQLGEASPAELSIATRVAKEFRKSRLQFFRSKEKMRLRRYREIRRAEAANMTPERRMSDEEYRVYMASAAGVTVDEMTDEMISGMQATAMEALRKSRRRGS